MPIREQNSGDADDVRRVTQRVQKLIHSEFKHKEHGVKPCSDYLSMYDDPDGHELFSGLSDSEKRQVLSQFVDWSGFGAAQRSQVINNVLDQHYDHWIYNEITSRWFEGVILVNEAELHASLTRIAAEIKTKTSAPYRSCWNNEYADRQAANEPDKYRIIQSDARESIVEYGWSELRSERQIDILEHGIDWQGSSLKEQYAMIAREVDLDRLVEHQRIGILERIGIDPETIYQPHVRFGDPLIDKGALKNQLEKVLPTQRARDGDRITSPADLAEGNGGASQQQDRGHTHSQKRGPKL
jgi:hypothetical protein